jgi:hypothetical protein
MTIGVRCSHLTSNAIHPIALRFATSLIVSRAVPGQGCKLVSEITCERDSHRMRPMRSKSLVDR